MQVKRKMSGGKSAHSFYPAPGIYHLRIILERGFLSAGMKQARKNHLWERILIRRDEISEEESSLGESFYPQG